jgi:hypothetical protein
MKFEARLKLEYIKLPKALKMHETWRKVQEEMIKTTFPSSPNGKHCVWYLSCPRTQGVNSSSSYSWSWAFCPIRPRPLLVDVTVVFHNDRIDMGPAVRPSTAPCRIRSGSKKKQAWNACPVFRFSVSRWELRVYKSQKSICRFHRFKEGLRIKTFSSKNIGVPMLHY